jgi:hypothetical protein
MPVTPDQLELENPKKSCEKRCDDKKRNAESESKNRFILGVFLFPEKVTQGMKIFIPEKEYATQ